MNTTPLLHVAALQVSYDRVPAIMDVSLDVCPGQLVALVGGNGNGKSTTLRAIAGLNRIDAGRIEFQGNSIDTLPAHARVPLGLSLVPEGRRLFGRLTVERNLQLGAYTRRSATEISETLESVYQLFPILRERRRQLAGTMSGGEQQMLALARGMMARPRLLLLDEPSWGIAPKFVTRVLDTIQLINEQGVSVLLVEQNLHKALALADQAYVIQSGRIVMRGSGKELLSDEGIKRAYLGL